MAEKEAPKILIVHHSHEHADDLRVFLEGHGFRATSSRSILDAEDSLASYRFDIVLLSILLPDGNGLEFCRRIKKDPSNPGIKVILISSIPQSGRFAMEAKSKYFSDGYLEEPIPMPDLVNAVIRISGIAPPQAQAHGKPARSSHRKAPTRTEFIDEEMDQFGATELDADAAPGPATDTRRVAVAKDAFLSMAAVNVPFEGVLGEVLFPELLLYFYQVRAEGNLQIRVFDEERNIYFRDGIPQFIWTNFIMEESLGQLLIRQKHIDMHRLRKILEKAKESGALIGDVLVSEGVLSQGELGATLKRQARFKIVNVFKLTEGAYRFIPGKALHEVTIRLDSDVLRILMAGIGRHMNLAALEQRIFSNRHRVVKLRRLERVGPAELGLTRKQWGMLGLADGERNLGDIIADSNLNFKQTFQTIYLLFLFGFYFFADDKPGFFHLEEPVLARLISDAKTIGAASIGDFEQQDKIPPHGDLAETGVTELIYRLHLREETGILTIEIDEISEKILLRKGRLIKIETLGTGRLMLGEILRQEGLLTDANRASALVESKETGRPLGEVLLGRGLLSHHQLFEILKLQIEKKLQFLFHVREGSFTFENLDPKDLASEMTFDIDIAKLAIQSMKDALQLQRLEKDMYKYKGFILERTLEGKRNIERLFMDPRDIQLFGLINGHRNLAQILERSPIPEKQTLQTLFVSINLGLLRFIQE